LVELDRLRLVRAAAAWVGRYLSEPADYQ